jgi:hypothetical protein
LLALLAWTGATAAQPAPLAPMASSTTAPAVPPGDVDGSLPITAAVAASWHPDLLIGLPTGLRLQRTFADDGRHAWVGEAFVGLELIFPMAGVGLRRRFTPICGENNCLRFSPGIDVYGIHWNFDGGQLFGHSEGSAALLGADVDVTWEHSWTRGFGSELGVKVGVGEVLGRNGSFGVPIICLFGGFRF